MTPRRGDAPAERANERSEDWYIGSEVRSGYTMGARVHGNDSMTISTNSAS
jgi:hypothetical protein